jgi:hypothetical protein
MSKKKVAVTGHMPATKEVAARCEAGSLAYF